MIPARDGDTDLRQVAEIPNQVLCHEQVDTGMPVQNVALIVLLSHNPLLGGMLRAEPGREAGHAGIMQRNEARPPCIPVSPATKAKIPPAYSLSARRGSHGVPPSRDHPAIAGAARAAPDAGIIGACDGAPARLLVQTKASLR